jgi:hypothetical protein
VLLEHAATTAGREKLFLERGKLQKLRDKAAAEHGPEHPLIVQVDEYLQRFALVLDKAGSA